MNTRLLKIVPLYLTSVLLLWLVNGNTVDINAQSKILLKDTTGYESFKFNLVDIVTLDTGYLQKTKNSTTILRRTYGSSLLGNIKRAFVVDSLIIIWENHTPDISNIYIFNEHGEFLKKINRGKGPNEIINVQSIALSPSRKKIAVLESSSMLREFSLEGVSLKTYKLPYSISAFDYCGEESFVLVPRVYFNLPYRLYYYDTNGLSPYPLSRTIDGKMIEVNELLNFVRRDDGSLYYTDFYTDTIYKISGKHISPEIILNFQKHSISKIQFSDIKGFNNIYEFLKEKDVFYKQQWFYLNQQDLYFFAADVKNAFLFQVNTANKEIKKVQIYNTSIGPTPIPLWKISGYCSKGLIFSQDPVYIKSIALSGKFDGLISPATKQKLIQLTDMSNPVLLIVK